MEIQNNLLGSLHLYPLGSAASLWPRHGCELILFRISFYKALGLIADTD